MHLDTIASVYPELSKPISIIICARLGFYPLPKSLSLVTPPIFMCDHYELCRCLPHQCFLCSQQQQINVMPLRLHCWLCSHI